MFTALLSPRLNLLIAVGIACCLLMAGPATADEMASAKEPNESTEKLAAPSLLAQALAYEHGEGVTKDQLRAAALYCEAARNGDPEAQFSLGWMYANGRGVARDDGVAASLFAMAAASGHVHAQKALQYVHAEPVQLPDCMRPPEPVVASAPAVEPPDPFADLPPHKQKIAELVGKMAATYAVNPRLALAVIAIESNFEPSARSAKDARGLMQLIPDTAARFKVKNAFEIKENLRGGLTYLRWLLSYYRGHVMLAVAAYNAGEKAVDRYRGIPPYPETRAYVRRVLDLFGAERHPYDPKVAEPSPLLESSGPGVM